MKSIIAIIIGVVLMFAGVNKLAEVECKSKWEDSGFATKYNFIGGCRIQTPDGKWIPAENYREVK
jgi:hypothetical protein